MHNTTEENYEIATTSDSSFYVDGMHLLSD
jgi:hypothetical protein